VNSLALHFKYLQRKLPTQLSQTNDLVTVVVVVPGIIIPGAAIGIPGY
jgi:hypothetical protein